MQEVFKTIPDYPNYKVSNLGKVYSIKNQIYIPDYNNGNGYRFVVLYKNKKRKQIYVHRLVGISFIPNPDNKPQINHIDLIKDNNIYTNLEWCTPRENNLHRYKHKPSPLKGRGGETHHNNKKVGCYDLNGKLLFIYTSLTIASKATGADLSSISACCNGKRNTVKKMIWKYI